jgi:hypothetical protein
MKRPRVIQFDTKFKRSNASCCDFTRADSQPIELGDLEPEGFAVLIHVQAMPKDLTFETLHPGLTKSAILEDVKARCFGAHHFTTGQQRYNRCEF